jgi:enamine deaminase RidA (YjgF/YER057c/UK114 family)
MVAQAIRTTCSEGCGSSTVELNDVRHSFFAAVPQRGKTFAEQAGNALRMIDAVAHEQGVRGAIVAQTVFLADMGRMDECRQIVRDFYGSELPATSYISQPPCEGKLLAIECFGVDKTRGNVAIRRINDQLVTVKHSGMTWAHCASRVPTLQALNASDDVFDEFERIRSLLDRVNIRFGQIVRTWFYCGRIAAMEGGVSRYQELNRARDESYRGIRFLDKRLPNMHCKRAYPASTAIGVGGQGIRLSAIALATDRPDVVAVPLENPRQTSAYDYSSQHGSASPKFSRAVVISCGEVATIFISGTASITSSETQHPGDAAAQTQETIDNIAVLISEDNMTRHGLPGFGTSLNGLGLMRAYIKRQEDYATVRSVCEKRLGRRPAIYAMADVCRPELLVEIEALAFSRQL